MGELLYLDVCCFKRPFDDQAQARIRREAEAVVAILERAEVGTVELVRSSAHDIENARNPREDRRLATAAWLAAATRELSPSPAIRERAEALVELGFGPLDALHLAFAELAGASWYLTTDDRLLARARRNRDDLRVPVAGPDEYLAVGRPGGSS